MKLRSGGYLGLALGERSIACAELVINGNHRSVRKAAVFTLPADLSFERPDALGKALTTFLRDRKFSSSHSVVGLPARWLISIERDVPPSGEDQARAMLRLQAERLSVAESAEVVFDYIGKSSPVATSKAMLLGVLRKRLTQIESALDTAGLRVAAISSSSLVLAGCAADSAPDLAILSLGSDVGELVWRHTGIARMLRHVPAIKREASGITGLGPVGLELGRAMAMVGENGNGSSRKVVLVDGVGLSDDQVRDLSERAGMQVEPGDIRRMLGVQFDPGATGRDESIDRFAPAVALAMAASDRAILPLDFKKSRLAPLARSPVSRPMLIGIVAAVIIVAVLGTLLYQVFTKQAELADLKARIQLLTPNAAAAQTTIDHVNYCKAYFDGRPPVLDCLREVTQVFKDDEHVWVTSCTIRERRCTLLGRGTDGGSIDALAERVKADKSFTDVSTPDTRDAGGRSKEQNFSIGFTFKTE